MRIPETHPPQGLLDAVLLRVALARRTRARVRFGLLAVVSCAATLLLIPALSYAGHEFYASGFYDYLTLAFTDGSLVFTSREFLLSLVDSLPSLAILILLAVGGALAWSLTRATRAARIAFYHLPYSA